MPRKEKKESKIKYPDICPFCNSKADRGWCPKCERRLPMQKS